MNRQKRSTPEARDLLTQAERAAAGKDPDKAFSLFEECVRVFLRRQMPFKAIAVSKRARTVLGPVPKASALIIRTFMATGLMGDARQEMESVAASMRKDDLAFFAALEEDAFLDLLSIMENVSYPKGRIVLRQQDPGEDVFVLLSGACEVIRDGKRLALLMPGDVFGEINFFGRTARSASVKTLEKSVMARFPSGPLRDILGRRPCLHKALEGFYSERIMKKVREDLEETGPVEAAPEVTATLRYGKGQEIPPHPDDSVAVVKHGIVEVDFDHLTLRTKRYLKPGTILSHTRIRALASTDVVIVLTSSHGPSGRGAEGV
ncbi:MAG TPA: cyclic nucleotide-binding domain-containing protein [Desulfomonilia bacterium]|jgi:CRP-like cAMP-binding protein|nr:cyclic nucleotide-binding domain-containing protein [Desulfomonilia bacterium]